MEVEILKRLALMGAVKGQVSLSSTRLGSSIGMSPQTAARRLVHLEKQGYIKRTVTPRAGYPPDRQGRLEAQGGILRLPEDLRGRAGPALQGPRHDRARRGPVLHIAGRLPGTVPEKAGLRALSRHAELTAKRALRPERRRGREHRRLQGRCQDVRRRQVLSRDHRGREGGHHPPGPLELSLEFGGDHRAR